MFKFYDNVFGAFYLYYVKRDINIFPRFGATIVVMTSQVMILFLIFAFLKKAIAYNLFLLFENRIYLIMLLILWSVISVNFYNKRRVEMILNNFSKKSDREKTVWGLMAVFSIVAPLMCIAFLLKK